MSTERDLARVVEAWLAEPEPPLDDGVVEQAIDRLPRTPQRKRWWPFRSFPLGIGATRTSGSRAARSARGSNQSLGPTSVAAGVAVLVVAGALVLVLGPLGSPGEPAPAPGAVSPSPASSQSLTSGLLSETVITGDMTFAVNLPVAANVEGDGWRGTRDVENQVDWESDDPRFDGRGIMRMSANMYPTDAGEEISAGWSEVSIETDDGTWVSLAPASGIGDGRNGQAAFWLDGGGSYEGSSAYMVQTLAWDGREPYWTFEVWVVPGAANLTQMYE